MSIPEVEKVISPASFPVITSTTTGDEIIILRDKTTSPKLRLISAALAGGTPRLSLNGGAIITERSQLNFIEGSNVTIGITDNLIDERADITITSSGDPYFASNVTGSLPVFGFATESIMIGDNNTNANNSGTESIMVGRNNTALTGTFNETIALGFNQSIGANNTIVIGKLQTGNFADTVLIGRGNNTTGVGAVTIGLFNSSSESSISIGRQAIASSTRTIALGFDAEATGADAVQIGTGDNTTASTLQYLDNTIANSDGIQAPVFATAPTSTPADGSIAIDNVANTLYFRSSGAWQTVTGGGGSSPLTTKGDLYTYDTADQRLPVGTDGQVLVANSATATGLEWQAAASNITSVIKTAATDTATIDAINLINGTTTLNLPAGTLDDIVIVADFGGTLEASPVTIVPNGAETIQGASDLILSSDNANVHLVFNGTNWHIYAAETFFDAGGSGGGTSLTTVLKTAATDSATISAVNIINGTTTINLPAGNQDDIVIIADIGNTFTASPLTILPNGVETIQGDTDLILNTNNSTVHLIFNSGNWTIFAAETFFDAGGSPTEYTNTESSSGVDITLTATSDNRQFISPTTNINCILPDTGIDNTSYFVIINDDPGSGDIAVKVGNSGNPTLITLNATTTYVNAAYTGTNWKLYS